MVRVLPGLGFFSWLWFYLAWFRWSWFYLVLHVVSATWPGVNVVRVLPGRGFFNWSGFYLVVHVVRVLPGRGFFMPCHGCTHLLYTFVNGHSSLKDCDVAALPIPDMIDGWRALWIVSF